MKRLRYESGALDATDAAILRELAGNPRATMAEVGRAVGLSAPGAAERVRRLEEAGVIRGYMLDVNPAALGLQLAALIRVRPVPGQLARVADLLSGMAEVVECDRVTGEDCFVARVHVASVTALEVLIDRILPLATTNTSVVQSSPVRRRPPLMPG